jgi:transposase
VPELLVCDNLKTGVTSSNPYEPDIQRTYEEMATYYGTAIYPARVIKPRDKAKAESGVQIVEERILAPLRNRQFFSLVEINQAIAPLLKELNQRQMQGRDHSRADLFAQLDAPALRPLPARPYELGLWSCARVHVDYHIAVDYRFYSVPYGLLKRQVDVRISGQIVEIFYRGERVASHMRVAQKYRCSTQVEHMPPAHQVYAEWTPERILAWLQKTGEAAEQVGKEILDGHTHPQQGFRACLGLVRLSKTYGAERTEAACRKALAIQSPSYKSVKAILYNNMDRLPHKSDEPQMPPVEHANIRGAEYYGSATGGKP